MDVTATKQPSGPGGEARSTHFAGRGAAVAMVAKRPTSARINFMVQKELDGEEKIGEGESKPSQTN